MSTSYKAALLAEYALVAQVFSAPGRLMILEQLAQGERGVDTLAEKTSLSVANCSQHLQQLRRAGLVTSRRDGKAVIYRLTDAKTLDLMDLIRIVAERNRAQVAQILRGLSDGMDAPEPVSRADLAARLADGTVTLIDVRPADEFAAGHIPGALNVPLSELECLLPDLPPDAQVVAYCRGPYCVYAHQAVTALRKLGIDARRLEGGFPEWREDAVKCLRDGRLLNPDAAQHAV
ncbi:metalloregulator ArsR/SmtB family transcription factor [Yoonia sp.]|uniref:ArsR/SmtB family transcription factor n=1 Tax=Yoonia sp. TaxID=2212373 RepID=UPI0019F15B34|nr:metalloregulator ArsR/SmtB family transcription factor [Yoonia sp.]MBE0413800.1 metalloregulator ArsR/SmtB family transcription factor [Yoonia sp.]